MTDELFRQLHAENVKRLDRIDSSASEQKDDLSEVKAGQARIEGAIERIEAIVDAHNGRSRDELTVLFGRTRDHGTEIQAIKVDYVPKKDFESHKVETRSDRDRIQSQLSEQGKTIAKWSGVIAFVISVLGLLAQYLKK